jgi:SnoaL-like domain
MFEETIGPSGVTVEDRLSINETLVRYGTGIDFKQWNLFRSCWTEDCHADYGGGIVFDGVDSLVEGMTRIHSKLTQSEHRLTNVDVLTWDGETATARSYTHAILVNANDPDETAFLIAGYYHDQLVRAGDVWKIDRRQWTTIWSQGNIGVMEFGEEAAAEIGSVGV